jgi:hypothetical protein
LDYTRESREYAIGVRFVVPLRRCHTRAHDDDDATRNGLAAGRSASLFAMYPALIR